MSTGFSTTKSDGEAGKYNNWDVYVHGYYYYSSQSNLILQYGTLKSYRKVYWIVK